MTKKDEIQSLATHILAKNKRLILQWATGVGKSAVAIKFLRDNSKFNCLILVPEENNIKNWENEFRYWNVSMDDVNIACYASFHKFKNTKWDLLVFDEAPHVDTVKRKAICQSVSGEYILALGAVLDEEEIDTLNKTYGEFGNWKITLDKAIKMNLLPPPTVYILHMQMDESDKKKYESILRNIEGAKATFNNSPTKYNQIRMLRYGNDRKRFLGSIKDKAAAKICAALELKEKRFICFCSSIAQAESLGGENAFTSKTPKSMKILDKFNNHEINSLYVVGKCIEGQNLVDIDCGVIVQLGGKSRITVQACGRVMRSANPIIYLPVFDETKDNSFLYTITSNISKDYIKHYNF